MDTLCGVRWSLRKFLFHCVNCIPKLGLKTVAFSVKSRNYFFQDFMTRAYAYFFSAFRSFSYDLVHNQKASLCCIKNFENDIIVSVANFAFKYSFVNA